MEKLTNPYDILVALTLLVQLALYVRWLYRHIRNQELLRAFVQDLATNHLPHIYILLVKICDKAGIPHDPLPPIRWVEINGRKGRND